MENEKNEFGLISDFIQEKISENQETEKPKKGRGRKSKEQIEQEQQQKAQEQAQAQMQEQINQALNFACGEIAGALTLIVATVVKDKKWIADSDDKTLLGTAINNYMNIRFPNWSEKAAPEMMLFSAVFAYIAKRIDFQKFSIGNFFKREK